MPTGGVSDDELATLTALERDRVGRVQTFMRDEFGYIAIQSTRPQTLAAALVDSPAGQLAWMIDKFHPCLQKKAPLAAVSSRPLVVTSCALALIR